MRKIHKWVSSECMQLKLWRLWPILFLFPPLSQTLVILILFFTPQLPCFYIFRSCNWGKLLHTEFISPISGLFHVTPNFPWSQWLKIMQENIKLSKEGDLKNHLLEISNNYFYDEYAILWYYRSEIKHF